MAEVNEMRKKNNLIAAVDSEIYRNRRLTVYELHFRCWDAFDRLLRKSFERVSPAYLFAWYLS